PASGSPGLITYAGLTPTSRMPGCSPYTRLGNARDIPDEETTDWRAVCGKTARAVRRAGRRKPSRPLPGHLVRGFGVVGCASSYLRRRKGTSSKGFSAIRRRKTGQAALDASDPNREWLRSDATCCFSKAG